MFEVEFDNLNDALHNLSYARVYQSPIHKDNQFSIEVIHDKGGNYNALKELIKMAEDEGFIYDRYYEMMSINGVYEYTAEFHADCAVGIYYRQDGVFKLD